MAKIVAKVSIKVRGVVCLLSALLGLYGVSHVRPYTA